MVKGKTSTGFSYSIDEEVLYDVEFLELFTSVQKGDVSESFALVEKILGKDQKKSLYDHVRNKKGFVPTDKVSAEVSEILEALNNANETKNS